jgi:hypothetical protein
MEAQNIGQWYAILFCVKLGENANTTRGKHHQDFGDDAMSRVQAFLWHKMFSEGRTFVEDQQQSGRPSSTQTNDNTALVRECVRSNQRLKVTVIADKLNMNEETFRLILTEELRMRKICAKMVPMNLTQEQRDAMMSVCANLLEQVEADPHLMDQVISDDESWFFQYDLETKHQS